MLTRNYISLESFMNLLYLYCIYGKVIFDPELQRQTQMADVWC